MLSRGPIKRGIEAALIASVPQVLLTKLEERLMLEPDEDADLGPRFIERLARLVGQRRIREDTKWLAASAFHFGYATFWGTLYGLAHRRWRMHPLLGGTVLTGIIYTITFPHWGGAVVSGAQRPPHRRSWALELALATAAATFGFGTALLYGRRAEGRDELREDAEARADAS